MNTGQLDIRGTVNMNPSTQAIVLGDIARSLEAQEIRKLVIVNSHGGNDFRQMIRELQASCGVFIASINWWSSVDPKPFYDIVGDHAGELETSVMMEIAPDLLLPLSEAGDGHAKSFRIGGLKSGSHGRRGAGLKSLKTQDQVIRPARHARKAYAISTQ